MDFIRELEMKLKAGVSPESRRPPSPVSEGTSTTCLVNVTKVRAKGPKGRRLPQRKSMMLTKSSAEEDSRRRPTSLFSPHTNSTDDENTSPKAKKGSKRISLPPEMIDHKKDVDVKIQRSSSTFDNVKQSPGDTDNGDIQEPTRVRPKLGVNLFGQNAAFSQELERKLKARKTPGAKSPPLKKNESAEEDDLRQKLTSVSSPHINDTVEENTSSKAKNESINLSTEGIGSEKDGNVSSEGSTSTFQTIQQSLDDTKNDDNTNPRSVVPRQKVNLLEKHDALIREPEKKPKVEMSSVVNRPPPPLRSCSLSNLHTKGSVEENTSSKANKESNRKSFSTEGIGREKCVDVSSQGSSSTFQTVQQSPSDIKDDVNTKTSSFDTKQVVRPLDDVDAVTRKPEKKPKAEISEVVKRPPSPVHLKSECGHVGIRVVRGPDWKWDNQDGGEGSVGTVVEDGSTLVSVQWDNGIRKKYRAGLNGAYDLRILDNAPIGVRHRSVYCGSCQNEGIFGIRWKCVDCPDYDLCTPCYMAGRHDVTHQFLRILNADPSTSFKSVNCNSCQKEGIFGMKWKCKDCPDYNLCKPCYTEARHDITHQFLCIPNTDGVVLPKRDGCVRIQMKGIFPTAKVVRGPDWQWLDQDGGAGKVGRVLAVRHWDSFSDRNAVAVEWSATSKSKLYRLGRKGKVDVKYVQAAADGFYYKDHLPILGDEIRAIEIEKPSNSITEEPISNHGLISENRQPDINMEDRISKMSSLTKNGIMHLSASFKDLFSKEKFCDVKIKVRDQTFQAHKAILAARSPYFALNLQENDSILEVTDCSPSVFQDFLYYVYTGEILNPSIESVVDLSEIADKFADEVLKNECTRVFKKLFAVESFHNFIAAA